MSFGSIESSRQLAIPVILMLFSYGPDAGDVYAYTSAEDPIIYNGTAYEPVALASDAFNASGSLDKSSIDIRLDKFLPISALFVGFPPSQPILVSVFMGHVGETNYQLIWPGRIRSAAIDQDNLVLTCEPISTSMRRSGLRRHWQRPCPHAVYSQGEGLCNAQKSSFTVTPTVQGVTSPYLTLPANWQGSNWAQTNFTNGIAQWTDGNNQVHFRTVLLINSPTQILLDGECTGMVEGTVISLSLGCDHSIDNCENIFLNINNYGGDPWIPLKNPLGIVNNFS